MVRGARRAPFEVRLHSGDGGGIAADMFKFDVPVELLEALFAGEFGSGGAEQPADQIGVTEPARLRTCRKRAVDLAGAVQLGEIDRFDHLAPHPLRQP